MIEKLTRFLKNSLPAGGMGRQMGWVMTQSGVETGLMTIAAFLAARLFGDVLLGQMGVLLAGVQLITMMGDGLYAGIIRQVSQKNVSSRPDALSLGWILCWISIGLICGITVFEITFGYFIGGSFAIPIWLLMAGLVAIGRVSRTSFESAFRAVGQFKWPCVLGSATIGIGALSIIILTVLGYRVTMYLSVQAIALVLNAVGLVWVYKTFLKRPDAHDNSSQPSSPDDNRTTGFGPQREFLRYTSLLMMRGIVAFLYLKVNIWLIYAMSSDADAGQFMLVDRFLTPPRLIMSAALAAFAPQIAPALIDKIRLGYITARVQGLMLLLSVPFFILFVFSPWLILPFFPDYGLTCRMLQIYAPSMLIMGFAFAASILLVQSGHAKAALWISIWSSIANVAGVYFGLRIGGAFESMIATSVVHAATGITLLILTYRMLGLRFYLAFRAH